MYRVYHHLRSRVMIDIVDHGHGLRNDVVQIVVIQSLAVVIVRFVVIRLVIERAIVGVVVIMRRR